MSILNCLVSILHHKYNHEGVRLDLAYIAPRVIAAAEPRDGSLFLQYRTKVADLERFLCARHGDHWHVWNLQEDAELTYDPQRFGVNSMSTCAVSRHPIRDHCPLPFHQLIGLVREIQIYLRRDKRNVALVHCKCGKGRTGMVVSTYLIAAHGDTDEEANREFTRKRIRYSIVKGVSINSQLRYLRYASDFYHSGQSPEFLRRGPIRIVAVSVRYSQYADFLFSLSSLDLASNRPTQNWRIVTRRDYLTVMHLPDDQSVFPADIICEFTGFDAAGSTVPVTFSFNATFESQNPSNKFPERPPLSSSTPPPYGPQALSLATLDSGIHRFRCEWGMVDGLYGTPWLGPRLFDSIEIFWKDDVQGFH